MLCPPVRFLSRTVQAGCVFTLRESFQTMPWRPDGQEETHGPESADSSIDAYWLLSQATKGLTLSASVPAHVRVFVCVWLCERKSEEKKTPHKQRGKKWPESQTIWTGLSQLAVKADFREFRACSPTCFAPRAATATCPRKCPLSLLNLSVSGHEKAARSAALAQTQVQVKVICLTHTHAPAQTNEGTGERPKCFDTLSCAEVNGVVVRLCKRFGRRVFLPNPFTLVWF